MPEDSIFEINPESETEFLDVFHNLKLTDAQANGLREWYYPYLAAGLKDAQKVVKTTEKECMAALAEGLKPDEFRANQNYKARAFQKYATDEVKDLVESTGLGNLPAFNEMFVNIGKDIGESLFVKAEANLEPGGNRFGKRSNAELASNLYPAK